MGRPHPGMDRQRGTLAFLVLLIIVGLIAAFVAGGWLLSLGLAAVVAILLWVTRSVWLPPETASTRLGIFSLVVVQGVALLAIGGRPIWEELLATAFTRVTGIEVSSPPPTPGLLTAATMAFVLGGVYIVNRHAASRSVLAPHETMLRKEFPEKRYHESLQAFVSLLRDHLRELDSKTNWSGVYFTPLQAEVEVRREGGTRRRISDLLGAIRSSRESRVFLVLGDPGSGKSVALRKLAMDLLEEVPRTGRVPIYVNLKEWQPVAPWTEANPPSVEQLHNFIRQNLKDRCDVFGVGFVDRYFDEMLRDGRFFILLDSFDEIPAVLDVSEASWMIERLSAVISRFFAGTTETRGLVSSRHYRRPQLSLENLTVLEIRPFTEPQIAESLRRSIDIPEGRVMSLFRDRPDLVPIARNPLTAALIRNFLEGHNFQFPDNQLQLYQSYIRQRLAAAGEHLRRNGLDEDEVVDGAMAMAWEMFNNPHLGLEAPLSILERALPGRRVRLIARALEFARLARVGTSEEARFSFVHRRFSEFLVAEKLRQEPGQVLPEAIPSDSRWREALVLYCEVAEEAHAREIALYCWSEVQRIRTDEYRPGTPEYLRAIHCLRFLNDAFRARRDCIAPFEPELAAFILEQITPEEPHLLSAKLSVEATGLLTESHVQAVVLQAFKLKADWISQTSIRACRNLPRLDAQLEQSLIHYLNSLSTVAFSRQAKETSFSLSLSDAFSRPRRFARLRRLDSQALVVLAPLALLAAPALCALLASLSLFAFFIASRQTTAFGEASAENILRYGFLGGLFAGMVTESHEVLLFGPLAPLYASLRFGPWPNEAIGPLIWFGYFLVGLALLPIYKVTTWQWKKIVVSAPLFLVAVVVGGVGTASAMEFLDSIILIGLPLSLLLAIVFSILIGAIFVVFLLALLFEVATSTRALVHDWKRYKAIALHQGLTRQDIEEQFHQFATSRGRYLYVRALQQARIKPTGTWKRSLPNARNDEASCLLARLEEGWLGLDR